jgi:hypothetical protein
MLAINNAGLLRRLLALVQTALTATADNQDNRAVNNGTPTLTGAVDQVGNSMVTGTRLVGVPVRPDRLSTPVGSAAVFAGRQTAGRCWQFLVSLLLQLRLFIWKPTLTPLVPRRQFLGRYRAVGTRHGHRVWLAPDIATGPPERRELPSRLLAPLVRR